VHDLAHPQLTGLLEGKPAPVGIPMGLLLVHQPMASEQAMHRRWRQREILGHLGTFARLADDQLHRKLRIGLLGRKPHLDYRWRERACLAAVGTWFRQQRIEAPAAVALQPIAQRLGGHPRSGAPGEGVFACGLLFNECMQPLGSGGQVHEIGDNKAISWQRSASESFMGFRSWHHSGMTVSSEARPEALAGPLPLGVGECDLVHLCAAAGG
jgi:hypothetical protein